MIPDLYPIHAYVYGAYSWDSHFCHHERMVRPPALTQTKSVTWPRFIRVCPDPDAPITEWWKETT